MSTKRQAARTLTQYLAISITGRNGHFNLLGLFFVFPRTVFLSQKERLRKQQQLLLFTAPRGIETNHT